MARRNKTILIVTPECLYRGSKTLVFLLLFPAFSLADTSTGLIAWWRMDEGTGTTVYDSSGQGKNAGIVNFSDPPTSTSGWASGSACKRGACLIFNGSNNYFSPGQLTLLDNVSQFTLAAWGKRANNGNFINFGRSFDITKRINVNFYSDGNIYVNIGDGAGQPHGRFACNDTNWHHVVAVFDGTQGSNDTRLKIYLDGIQQNLSFNGTIPATTVSEAANFYVGWTSTGANNWSQGVIDDVRVYTRALTAQDVFMLYTNSAQLRNGVLRNLNAKNN